MTGRLAPFVALILVTAVWGVTFVQIKDALELYPLFAFLAVRFAIAVAVLAVPVAPRLRSLGGRGALAGASLGGLLAAGYALQTAGLERTTVSAAGFVTGMYVVLTPVFALVLFRLRPGTSVWIGVALAVIGLGMLSGVSAGSGTGDLLVLAAAALYALQIALMERFAPRYDAARVHDGGDGGRVRRLRRDRRCRRTGRVAARRDGLGRLARDGHLRERARLPRPGVGAKADERDADGTPVLPRARLRGDLRLRARRRQARAARLGGLRRDPDRDRDRRARRGQDARPSRARPETGLTAVALAVTSAALFGAMTVAVRIGFSREPDAALATASTVTVALTVAVVAALVAGPHDVTDAWPYALAGLLAPGISQLLFTFAIRTVGASRTSVVVGAAPLAAVAIAFLVLGEPVTAPLVIGAFAIVAGGVALVAERRPEHLRASGLVLAAMCTLLFAARDNLVRHLSGTSSVPPTVAAATTLLVGAIVAVAFARRPPSPAALRVFAPAGLCFGLSYICLFAAYYRGRVSVVSPLVATETLWGVGLSVLLLRRSELVGRRLLAGAALIVAGGVLIGIYR